MHMWWSSYITARRRGSVCWCTSLWTRGRWGACCSDKRKVLILNWTQNSIQNPIRNPILNSIHTFNSGFYGTLLSTCESEFVLNLMQFFLILSFMQHSVLNASLNLILKSIYCRQRLFYVPHAHAFFAVKENNYNHSGRLRNDSETVLIHFLQNPDNILR